MVKRVTINRAEGPARLCVSRSFPGFDVATAWLRGQAHTFPPPGDGYHKVFYNVDFVDGHSFKGRLDCMRRNVPDVRKEIVEHCVWMAGEEKNPHCGEERYQQHLQTYGQETVCEYKRLLEALKGEE